MSKEHFNGSSTNKSAVALRLLPLTLLLVMGAFLMFYDKTLQVAGPWGAKSFGIGMALIAAAEMIAYEQRLRFNTPPSPASSIKSNNSNLDVVSGMIVLAIVGGYILSKKF
jgi:hypothetical protein